MITEYKLCEQIPTVDKILFVSRQNIPWNEVEQYLKEYIGRIYVIEEYQDEIKIGSDFPDEYAQSRYTKNLRGAVAKAKANAVQILDDIIKNATNRRWVENKAKKHNRNAALGWYRYDTYFQIPVQGSLENTIRLNRYIGTLIVRKTEKGLYLYDIINIKKEASKPLSS